MPTVLPGAPDLPDVPVLSSGHHGGLRRTLPAVAVHTALRREFRLAVPLVGRVESDDADRAATVAAHLEFLLDGLDHHHRLEDELIWPRLRVRAESGRVPVIATMESQHERLHVLIGRISGLLPTFRSAPSAEIRAQLADLLIALRDGLSEHLDLEEREGLPLAEAHLTEAEWCEIAEQAEPGGALRDRLLSLGMIQYEADPKVLSSMLRPAPPPVRFLLPRLARRAFRRHAVAVHGTPTP